MSTPEILPKIGVVGYFISEKEEFGGKVRGIPGQAFAVFGYDMIMAVYRAGGIPVPLPVVEKEFIGKQVANVDGIVFSGGEDIDPGYYGQTVRSSSHRIDPDRDRYELALMDEAMKANRPMLCVCRGMQLLNVYRGGTLCADIGESGQSDLPHWETREPWNTVHPVEIAPGHFAEEVLGSVQLGVNSIHHQSIDRLGQGLEVVGRSPDGLVEAMAVTDSDSVLAVQWHPELIARKHPEGLRPFRWLIETAVKHSKRVGTNP